MKVVFMPAGKSVEVEYGKSILQTAIEQGVIIDSPCGGHHTCGKCKVLVTKGNDHKYLEEETALFTKEELARGMRLACCLLVTQDMTVMVPSSFRIEETKHSFLRKKSDPSMSIGIAVDVGTTTVEVHFVDLSTSVILRKCRFYNPQIAFGADVIARITYAAGNSMHEKQLKDCLIEKLEETIRREVRGIGAEISQITKMAVVGNTTMSYILTGTPLSYLAKAPFSLVYPGNTTFSAKEIGILKECNSSVYVGPNIGGHVGSDAFACLLAVDGNREEGPYMIVDVGTNGEILLIDKGKTYACSTAAGPAFEGAGLSCGMRADIGAITKAEVKEGAFSFQVEGNVAPRGISGSGIIDLLAGLLKLHRMNDSGYLDPIYCGEKGYEVAEGVFISREDIRQIQLAKGAIYAGISTLLKVANVHEKELSAIYLAGAFGSAINIKNAMLLGLLPKMGMEKVHYIGNAAIKGAKLLLIEDKDRMEYEQMHQQITHVELADVEGFQKCFIKSINFRSDLC